VARYYRLDPGRNRAVSTEITGYAASAFVFLHWLTDDDRYMDRARAAARFLIGAWDAESGSMPFEVAPAQFAYFFDCGIVVRGLLAVWRGSGGEEFLDCARLVGDSMAHDFRAPDGRFHPILTLPAKRPVERDPLRWSQSPGCYQLKAGMAWWDLWEATGNACYRDLYEGLREESLRTAPCFLPGHADRRKVVDRLHAYLYFLEGLLPMPDAALEQGIQRVGGFLREFAPEFERSDVYAQLLRLRLCAASAGVAPLDRAAKASLDRSAAVPLHRAGGAPLDCADPASLDRAAKAPLDRSAAVPLHRPAAAPLDRDTAQWEAERLLEFSAVSEDPRIDGGFYFGRTAGNWEPYINPVSAAFALQALALWNGARQAHRHLLI